MPAWILSFRTGNVLRTKRSTWFLVNAKISTASSSRLACWPCAKKCSNSKQSGN
jgi:hypothetical protein